MIVASNASDREKDDPVDDVQDAEPLVVDGRDPAVERLEERAGGLRLGGGREAGSREALGGHVGPRLPSAQRLQVVHERVEPLLVELHRRHQDSGLERRWDRGPRPSGSRPCWAPRRGQSLPAHQVREVRTVQTVSHRSADGVAVEAGRRLEDPPALRATAGARRRATPAASATQRSKSSRVSTYDSQEHLRVLRAAELGALPDVEPRARRGSIQVVLTLFGMRSVFPARRGTQKLCATSAERRVRNVGAGMGGIADRHVQLVGRHDPERGIAKLPPPLAADDRDLQSSGRLGPILDLEDRSGGRQPRTITIRTGITVHATSTCSLP